ncbi:unnamed protein product [Kluyveromyces dobzhanskii CBS 2104]|uniref:Chitin biosynthesis protein CHS5 n=1 Tax=Kluyveromyces dobzhanskii CBS 2104 TaxID=1427455 RepID=A0A0A8L4A6_9SACH|nr:unnamed protein product [Kluyveromyces dobzhanskii CBS 2104]
MVEVSLTVGKVDASLAILTTADHYVIEFPTVLLPESVEAGSVVTINVEQDIEQEKKQKEKFQSVQEQILAKYGSDGPKQPVLQLANATQTSCVIRWNPIHLGSSQLKSLILYKQGNRQQVIAPGSQHDSLGDNSLKISGLSVDVEYEFKLLLNTSSGKFWSNSLRVHTHKMTDMSGITVCVGPKTDLGGHVSIDQIKSSLEKIGAKPLQDHVTLETTHFIATHLPDEESFRTDEELARASDNNIPIVRPEWIRACELEKRIVGVRDFYLDSDPSNLSNYRFTEASVAGSLSRQTIEEEAVQEEAVQEEAVPEEAVPEEAVPEDTVPEDTVPEDKVPEEAVQEEAVPEDTVPEDTAPEDTVPEDTVPEDTVLNGASSKEVVQEDALLEETAQVELEPAVIEEISLEEPVLKEVALEEPTSTATLEAPAPEDSTELDGNSAQPQTEETSPEAEDVTKNSSAGTSNSSSKKRTRRRKRVRNEIYPHEIYTIL